jgi:hypothetical protein
MADDDLKVIQLHNLFFLRSANLPNWRVCNRTPKHSKVFCLSSQHICTTSETLRTNGKRRSRLLKNEELRNWQSSIPRTSKPPWT